MPLYTSVSFVSGYEVLFCKLTLKNFQTECFAAAMLEGPAAGGTLQV